jgi:hypothetical protein
MAANVAVRASSGVPLSIVERACLMYVRARPVIKRLRKRRLWFCLMRLIADLVLANLSSKISFVFRQAILLDTCKFVQLSLTLICWDGKIRPLGTRPHRLGDQDAALSRLKPQFESGWGQRNGTVRNGAFGLYSPFNPRGGDSRLKPQFESGWGQRKLGDHPRVSLILRRTGI